MDEFNQNNQPVYDNNQQPSNDPGQSNGKAVAALVLGIISVICIFFGYGAFVGIGTGIAGLIVGSQAKKECPCSMATAGFILSLIAMIACAISFIGCIACAGFFAALGAEGLRYLN